MGGFGSVLRERLDRLTTPQRTVLLACAAFAVYQQRSVPGVRGEGGARTACTDRPTRGHGMPTRAQVHHGGRGALLWSVPRSGPFATKCHARA